MATILRRNTNQALGLAHYAKEFMSHGMPSEAVFHRVKLFHTDSVLCGLSALAMKTNAPTVLRNEAVGLFGGRPMKGKPGMARLFGRAEFSLDYKAIAANCSAVREWDSNGTVFGYHKDDASRQAGEFGHNDFYPVVMAAADQEHSVDGKTALKAMILLDEIRGRLAESFSLKTHKVDHVVHGAIASIVTYGTLLHATPEQIESAIGMFVAHYIPFRAIRAGHQLSDSKGASAALSTEVAIMSLRRSMAGFVGPKDIFRNPEAIFRLFGGVKEDQSPFDLHLENEGDDFAVRAMHFKLGLYEHQSAGAIHGVLENIKKHEMTNRYSIDDITSVRIKIYQPAFGIIGDPAKRDPHTRQSADHSMVYIIGTLLRKAFETQGLLEGVHRVDDLWMRTILLPADYSKEAIHNPETRKVMKKIEFVHGGEEFDSKYPEGIPTSVEIEVKGGLKCSSKVMFPAGHAANTRNNLEKILKNKFSLLAHSAVEDPDKLVRKLQKIEGLDNDKLTKLYQCNLVFAEKSIDE